MYDRLHRRAIQTAGRGMTFPFVLRGQTERSDLDESSRLPDLLVRSAADVVASRSRSLGLKRQLHPQHV